MKKVLLTFSAFAIGLAANAQRLVLLEEFTGETCPPCAYWNPQIMDMMNQAGEDKVQIIKYQVPIPTKQTGGIYDEYEGDADGRRTYYSVNSAPSVLFDGAKLWQDNNGNPSAFPGYGPMTTADITTAAAVAAPFDVAVEGRYSTNNDSLIATVTVKATSSYTATGALKLRLAYVQTLDFTGNPPGTNGEEIFENVVRKMYPGVAGTTMDAAWTSGTTKTYVIGGKVPAHLKATDGGHFVAWVQHDGDKKILQSARSSGNAFRTNVENVASKEVSEVTVYPNPASTESTVRVTLRNATSMGINVTDLAGRVVFNIPASDMVQGTHDFTIPTHNLANGTYNVSIVTGLGTVVERLTVVK